ncbi:MAG: cell division protein FtsA [Porphyromonas sp.]|nr:cell division protein FtsA [Porphyromonas sp.]
MKDNITVAVIDFGSHSIKAALAEKYSDGRYLIKYHDQEPSEGCVVRGKIHNLTETAQKVREVLDRLERKAGRKIDRVHAAVGGQSLQSYSHVVEQVFDDPHEITQEDIDLLQQQVDDFAHEKYMVLAEVSPTYFVNGSYTRNPVGVQALNLKVEYQLILADSRLSDNIDLVLQDKLGLEVMQLLMSPIVLADRFLTEEQKRIGCALVDMGAACTTVCVYRRGALDRLRVIPLGSQNITNDLTWMHISPSEAERVKVEKASLTADAKDTQAPIEVKAADMVTPKHISRLEVNQYVEARAREIIDNIKAVCTHGRSDVSLPGGVVLTGAGSKLRGIGALLSRVMEVHVEHVTSLVSSDRPNEYYILQPEWHVVYSMYPYATNDITKPLKVEQDETTEEEQEPVQPFYPEDQLEDDSFMGVKSPEEGQTKALFSEEELSEQEQIKVAPPKSVPAAVDRSPKKKRKPINLMERGKNLFDRSLEKLTGIMPSDDDEDSYDRD